jgi:glycosyltransferase involved in cell wall biosynthesis
MKRYAQGLTQALQALDASDWQFEALTCHRMELATRFLPGKLGETAANRLGRFVRYPALARQTKGDIYHIIDHSHANLLDALPAERTVITCHDIIPLLAARGKIPIPATRAARWNFPRIVSRLSRCAAVITGSESTRQNLVEYTSVRPERIHLGSYGLSPDFGPTPPEEQTREQERATLLDQYQIPRDTFVIMHVGTTGRYKNTPALVRILKGLRTVPELNDRVWLLRVGVPFDKDVEALVESLGVRDRLVQTGKIEGDLALARHYRSADVFVFPSLWEGFGWPPLEAMACGTPAVVSNVASLPEVVGAAGLTVDPNDTQGFVDAIRSLLSDPARREQYRILALAQAQRFTWERSAREALIVYEKILVEQGRR